MQVVDVPTGSGITWLREAWRLFSAQPLAWISITSAWVLLSLLLMLLPLIGLPLCLMLQPGFFAGFVLACRDQEAGRPVMLSHLFLALKQSGRPLIQVGALTLLAGLLVQMGLGATGIFDGIPKSDDIAVISNAIRDAVTQNLLIWLPFAALQILISGVLWFSAAILAQQSMPASHAIRWSFFAFIGNIGALTVFGLLLMVFLLCAMLPMGLGLLVFFPIYAISHFTSYQSVFGARIE